MTATSIRLRYDLANATTPDDPDDRSGFITIYAWCPARGEDKYDGVSITTNGHGEGRFVERRDGTYHQIAGTLQYHLPATESGMRRELRRLYLERDEERAEEEAERRWVESGGYEAFLAETMGNDTRISVSDDVLRDLHELALADGADSRYVELYYDRTTGEVGEFLHASRNSWTDYDEVKITAGTGGLEVGGRFLLPDEYEHDFENCFDELASDLPTPAGCDDLSDCYGRDDIVRYLHDGRSEADEGKDREMLREMWVPVLTEAFSQAM